MKKDLKAYFVVIVAMVLAQASWANGLIAIDSIGLERRNDQIYILYRVDPGETVYGIAQKYKMTTEELKRHNEGLDLSQIRIGQVLRIPIAMHSNFGYSVTTRPGQQAQQPEQPQATKKRIAHMVRAKESLYSISRQYNMDIDYLRRINGLTDNKLDVGQSLWVELTVQPSTGNTTVVDTNNGNIAGTQQPDNGAPWWAYKEALDAPANTSDVLHTAEPGETFLSIARRFNTTVAQLQAWNPNLTDPVGTGRTVVVGKVAIDAPKKVEQPKTNDGGGQLPGITGSGKMEIPSSKKVIGFGEMIQGNALTGSEKHMAMHNSADIGTYIKVTNPNTGKSTYAKVIARIPSSETNKDVVIKLSKETCDYLGISEPKFQVLLEYND